MNSPYAVFAIDPGLNGAWAVLDTEGGFVDCEELPRTDRMLNAKALAERVEGFDPARAVIERVASRPGQGVASVFTFGMSYGICLGVVSAFGIPVSLVTPVSWKKHFRLVGKDKDASRDVAIRLYPGAAKRLTLKKHHGRSDAILLARYSFDALRGVKFI